MFLRIWIYVCCDWMPYKLQLSCVGSLDCGYGVCIWRSNNVRIHREFPINFCWSICSRVRHLRTTQLYDISIVAIKPCEKLYHLLLLYTACFLLLRKLFALEWCIVTKLILQIWGLNRWRRRGFIKEKGKTFIWRSANRSVIQVFRSAD